MAFFDFQFQTRVVFGSGALERLGGLARELGFRKTLLVADSGLVACGHVSQAARLLSHAGIEVVAFHDFEVNPDTRMIETGSAFAALHGVDSITGLGGGSSLDCAKGINFLLTNGGRMQDYRGYGKAARPMLPMIGIPTTTGTGSEAQSYALISDAETHVKMACGARGAAFRIALLDPTLTLSQPRHLSATAGFDALAHAVETFVTTRRNPLSETFSREAWRLLEASYERVLVQPSDIEARGAMQLGAFYAGLAIENSMLGATHACANPLTARYGTEHGVAIALLLPWVVRWNTPVVEERYGELIRLAHLSQEANAGQTLAARLDELKEAGELPSGLGAINVPRAELETLAHEAAEQWTGSFNPRRFDRHGAQEIYEWAY